MSLAAEIEAWARQWGSGCRRFPAGETEANLLVFLEAGPAAPWLLFDSHLDTVATEGMAIAPFELAVKGDRLFGRGTCNAKGSGAAMLWALRAHAQAARRNSSVGVLFTVDEESRLVGARAFAACPLAEFRSRLRGIVVGEPTAMRPVVATNGVVRWRTITRGLAAHSSDPSLGRSAISAMVRVIEALEQHYVPSISRVHPLTGRASATIKVVSGGTQVNVIPDYCEILCDRRQVPGEDANDALAQRNAVFRGLPAVEHDSVYVVPPLSETATAEFYR